MPPKTRKRKASATESNTTEEPAPKKTTRGPSKTATRAERQRWLKNGAVQASGSSRLPLDLTVSSKKRKILVSDSKREIKNQKNDILKFIDKELKSRLPRFGKAGLEKKLSSRLTPVLPWMTVPSFNKKRDPQSRPQLLLKALNGLQRVVKTYETLAKNDSGIKPPTWMRWEQDVKELNELGRHGLNMASRIVNHVIMPFHHALPAKPTESAHDNEKLAWDLLKDAVPGKSEETWGKAVQSQVKAFSAVLKLLPAYR